MPKLLIVDDDRAILQLLRHVFRNEALEVLTATELPQGPLAPESTPDVALVDLILPGVTDLEAVRRLHEWDRNLPVILMTAYGNCETAIDAIKSGAFDYLLKPLDPAVVKSVVDRALRVRQADRVATGHPGEATPFAPDPGAPIPIIGRSPPMHEVFKAIGRVAPQTVTVLIHGESGTGKELIARAIHDHSPRAGHPFIAVNCAAVPESLLESELFGHERGAFTGAEERRIGKFEQCTGGTIFLDEIGDMSPLIQGKVLRVLQEQRFERVGGGQTVETDVRIVCATNRNLQRMVAKGEFREDLYYRLNGFSIRLPSLRERGDDLTLLLAYFVQRLGKELGKPVQTISSEAQALLTSYGWPGNVRELEAAIRSALLQTTGTVLLPESLPAPVRSGGIDCSSSGPNPHLPSDLAPFVEQQLRRKSGQIYADSQTLMERYVLTRVLQHARGNQSEAARLLGITRGCLRSRIRTLGITLATRINTEDDLDDGNTGSGQREQAPFPRRR